MSHNPNTVKSQDELNEGGRKSDVLVATLEKCERLQKQLDIAVEFISMIDRRKIYMCKCLKGCPLKKYYEKNKGCAACVSNACHTALQQIEELNK